MTTVSSRVIATCFALSSFAVAIIAGLSSGNPTAQILLRALVAMLVCYPIGMAVGFVCESVIRAHVEQHRAENPAPDSNAPVVDGSRANEEVIAV